MSHRLPVALFQMTSVDDVEANFHQIENLVNALKQPFEIAFFPENSLYMRLKEAEPIPGLKLEDPVFKKLSDLARSKSAALHLGSVPLWENGKLSNSSVMILQDGKIEVTYRKMHLFDITLEGQRPIRESDVFQHGPGPSVLDFELWKFGQSICYDIRFAELYSHYAKARVDAILVPSAFLVPTGQAHWEILLRARAIESQCYVIAAAQAGIHVNSQGFERRTFGQSMVIGPWGEIMAEASSNQPEALWVELDRTHIEKVRRQIPMQSHRRF